MPKKNEAGQWLIAILLVVAFLVVTGWLAGGCAPRAEPAKKSPATHKAIELPKTEDVGKTVGDRTHRFGKGFVDGWRNGNKTEPTEKKEKDSGKEEK